MGSRRFGCGRDQPRVDFSSVCLVVSTRAGKSAALVKARANAGILPAQPISRLFISVKGVPSMNATIRADDGVHRRFAHAYDGVH
jgi:hypothetical protein